MARIHPLAAASRQRAKLYRLANLHRLLRRGIPFPAAETADQGAGATLVEGAPPIGEVLPRLADLIGEGAVVGHNIGYDLTVLENEAARCGIDWRAPPSLDTALLMAALEPSLKSLDLE